jgi:hypothetical protein
MKVGDLVRVRQRIVVLNGLLHAVEGLHGVVLTDHSPMRPPEVGRVFDVMWNNGDIEEMYSDELEIV